MPAVMLVVVRFNLFAFSFLSSLFCCLTS